MLLQRKRDETLGQPPGAPSPTKEASNGSSTNRNTKKRKADRDEEPTITTKKAKGVDSIPGSLIDQRVAHEDGVELELGSQKQDTTAAAPDTQPEDPTPTPSHPPPIPSQSSPIPPPSSPHTTSLPTRFSPPHPAPVASIDEDEWAAFERDVATPPPPPAGSASALLASTGTITAAPLSAAEIAAQAREEAELQQTKAGEVEAEAEKEDAERRLEEEFEEMAGLEERVRVLKEKREALRKGGGSGGTEKMGQVELAARKEEEAEKDGRGRTLKIIDEGKEADEDDGGGGDSSDDDDDEVDGWDNWRK